MIDENNDEDKSNILTMLKTADNMTYKKIRDNLLIFFVAGHETTSTTLQYVMYNFAQNPDIQEKIREEVTNLFPQDLDQEKLKDLKSIDNFINETMRLYPPVTILPPRYFPEDKVVGDYHFSKNTFIAINVYLMHKDKEIWGEDVEEFKPDRWNNITKDQRNASNLLVVVLEYALEILFLYLNKRYLYAHC